MEDLQSKDKSIQYIFSLLIKEFGENRFIITDYWSDDNYAIGLKVGDKLIYISTWDYRALLELNFKCYAEFERVNLITDETIKVEGEHSNISEDDLISEIRKLIG